MLSCQSNVEGKQMKWLSATATRSGTATAGLGLLGFAIFCLPRLTHSKCLADPQRLSTAYRLNFARMKTGGWFYDS